MARDGPWSASLRSGLCARALAIIRSRAGRHWGASLGAVGHALGRAAFGAVLWARFGLAWARFGLAWARFGLAWARFGLAWAALGVCFLGCALIGGVGRGERARTVSPNNVYGNLQYWGWPQCDLAQVFGM